MHWLGRVLGRPLAEHILKFDIMMNNEASMAVLKSRQHLVTSKKRFRCTKGKGELVRELVRDSPDFVLEKLSLQTQISIT